MLDILWINFGLFKNSNQKTIEDLTSCHTKNVFTVGVGISILAMSSLFLSQMLLGKSPSPHTIFFQLLGYYIISYIFLSIIIFSLSLFHKRINTLKFLGIYFSLDFPYIIILPLALISSLYKDFSSIANICIFILSIYIFTLRLKLLSKIYNIHLTNSIVLFSIPFILLIIWILATTITVFNFSVS